MPVLGHSEAYSYSLTSVEGTCYTQLQPVSMDLSIGSLIASSTNMCLPEGLGESSCSGYAIGSHYHQCLASDDSASPQSPDSVYTEELSDIQEVIQLRMPGKSDDDDDSSVMFDFEDLAFLDQPRSRDFDTVTKAREEFYNFNDASMCRTTTTATGHTRNRLVLPMHFYDVSTVSRHEDWSYFPPTPSSTPSPRLQDVMFAHAITKHEEEEDDDDDAEYKPYCDSRRGAKKNLLWKFLLTVLDHHTDLAQWTDMKKGVFKFVDTAGISTMWGQRKHKNDMTFEKLSRGIRHYYKRGLMERLSNTRLVYKFNWEKVPKRFRKA